MIHHFRISFVPLTLYWWTVPTGVARLRLAYPFSPASFQVRAILPELRTWIKRLHNNDLGDFGDAPTLNGRRRPTLGNRRIGGRRQSLRHERRLPLLRGSIGRAAARRRLRAESTTCVSTAISGSVLQTASKLFQLREEGPVRELEALLQQLGEFIPRPSRVA